MSTRTFVIGFILAALVLLAVPKQCKQLFF